MSTTENCPNCGQAVENGTFYRLRHYGECPATGRGKVGYQIDPGTPEGELNAANPTVRSDVEQVVPMHRIQGESEDKAMLSKPRCKPTRFDEGWLRRVLDRLPGYLREDRITKVERGADPIIQDEEGPEPMLNSTGTVAAIPACFGDGVQFIQIPPLPPLLPRRD